MKAKKLPMGLRILFGFLSLILCVALFATTVLTMVLADIKVVTNEDNLQVVISYLMFGTPLEKKAPAVLPQAVGGMKLDETDSSNTGSMNDMVVDMLYEIFMQSSHPQYSKDAVSEKIKAMRESLAACGVADSDG